ncbi:MULTISPECIES: hypothetical protein [Pseudonocardia]|nr:MULTISPECIES: hypothetical protein [Pseudonocardia]
MAATTARDLDRRAAAATGPAKRVKLTAKATRAWEDVRRYGGEVPAGRLPVPAPAHVDLDAPTVRLHHVARPGARPASASPPERPTLTSRQKAGVGIGAAVLLFGGCGMLLGGSDPAPEGVDAASARPAVEAAEGAAVQPGPPAADANPADALACQDAASIIGDWSEHAVQLGAGTTLPQMARASDRASSDLSDAAVTAADPEVTASLRDASGLLEEAGAAARRVDGEAMTDIAGRSNGVFQGIVSACESAILGS